MALITNSTSNLGGDQSWLASAHAIWNGRSVTVDLSKFTKETHYPQGFVPQGFPVTIGEDGLAVPYDGTNLAGHLLNDYPVDAVNATGKIEAAALLDHGRVVATKVPFQGFQAPATQANTTINYL